MTKYKKIHAKLVVILNEVYVHEITHIFLVLLGNFIIWVNLGKMLKDYQHNTRVRGVDRD